MEYAQNKDSKDLFINVTTVFPASGLLGLPTDTLLGSAEVSGHPSRVPKRSKWQDCRIIPGYISQTVSFDLSWDRLSSLSF